MTYTADGLRNKSANLIDGIRKMLELLRTTNAEIIAQIKQNEDTVEQLKTQHAQTVAQLQSDNVELAALIEENEKFIQSVEKLLSE